MRDILLYLPAKLLPGGFALLTVFFLTNTLQPEVFGAYSYYLAVSLLISVITFNWLSLGVNRLYLNTNNEVDFKLKSTAMYTSLWTLGIAIVLVIILIFFEFLDSFYFIVLILAYSLSSLELLVQWAVIESKKVEYSIAVLIKPFFLVILSYYIYLTGAVEAELIIILISVFQLLSCAYTFYYGWRDINLRYFDFKKLKELLSYGLPLSLNFGLIYIVSSSDKLIIEHFFTSAEVGVYSATYDLFSQLVFGFGSVLTLVLYPNALRAYNESNRTFRKVIKLNFFKALIYLIIIAIFLIVFSPFIISYGLGDAYKDFAWSYFFIVIVMTAVYCFYSYTMIPILQLHKKVNLILLSSTLMAATNLSLNFIFMPIYGFQVGIYTTLISYLMGLFVITLPITKLLKNGDVNE